MLLARRVHTEGVYGDEWADQVAKQPNAVSPVRVDIRLGYTTSKQAVKAPTKERGTKEHLSKSSSSSDEYLSDALLLCKEKPITNTLSLTSPYTLYH